MSFDQATVTIPYADVERLRKDREKLAADVTRLQAELTRAQLGGDDGVAMQLLGALGHALKIVGYAIAHMPPLAFRGWPYQALIDLVNTWSTIPGMPVAYAEVKNDFLLFARECERWEKARAAGIEQQLFAEMNMQHAVGMPAGEGAVPPDIEELPPRDPRD